MSAYLTSDPADTLPRVMGRTATKPTRWFTVGIVVAISALSLGVRIAHHANTEVDSPFRTDAYGYYMTAMNLNTFGVYSRDPPTAPGVPSERRSSLQPGYPLLLMPILRAARSLDHFVSSVVLLQCLFGALLPLLAFALARSALSLTASTVVALLVALCPHLIALEAFVLTEAVFSFALVLSLLLFVRAHRSRGVWLPLMAGIALGLAQLIREVATPLPLLLAPLFLLGWRAALGPVRRVMVCQAGILLLGAGLVWAPQQWAMAHHFEGHPVEEVNRFWWWFANGSIVNLAHETDASRRPPEFEHIINDPSYGAPVLWARFLDDPFPTLAWYLGGKALFLWRWDNLYNGGVYQYPMIRKGFDANAPLRAIRSVMHGLHWPLHVLALLSLPVLLIDWRRGRVTDFDRVALPLLVVIFYHVALLSVFMPVPRYSIPLRPLVFVLAAGVMARGLLTWRTRSVSTAA